MTWVTPHIFEAYDVLAAEQLNDIQDNLTYVYTLARRRTLIIPIVPSGDSLSTGDGKFVMTWPAEFNGYTLVDADSCLQTVSSSGTPTFSLYNLTDSVDVFSTSITVDANEYNSYTAATQPVINTANDDFATGDRLSFNLDVGGTGAKGWEFHGVVQGD